MFLTIVEIVFWLSVFFVFYAYFGYPLILYLISVLRPKEIKKGDITPSVSFIIAAYNEEKGIGKKIENTLMQDYPKDCFEIIIASDCSSDRTDEIVATYGAKGVKLVRAPERKGKENAQKCAIEVAKGEILIFSDVSTMLDRRGVMNIVKGFVDTRVGCISSTDKFIDKDGNISGEGVYVSYEMFLRNLESRVNTLVGLSGSFFAVRKELCWPWATDLPSDFNTLLNAVRKGYRGVCDGDAFGYYQDLTDPKDEFSRKVRTVVRGIRVFMKSIYSLNAFHFGLFSWQFCSHKLCRWLVPFAMIIALTSNIMIANTYSLYLFLLALQMLFYTTAGFGLFIKPKKSLFQIPTFFVMANYSILVAWYKYLRGERFIKWEPSSR